MSRTKITTIRLPGASSDFVAANVGENGACDDVSEYVPDLIRHDKQPVEKAMADRLKAELTHAFAAPDSDYELLTAADIVARNRL